jgi:hypothetical protein
MQALYIGIKLERVSREGSQRSQRSHQFVEYKDIPRHLNND